MTFLSFILTPCTSGKFQNFQSKFLYKKYLLGKNIDSVFSMLLMYVKEKVTSAQFCTPYPQLKTTIFLTPLNEATLVQTQLGWAWLSSASAFRGLMGSASWTGLVSAIFECAGLGSARPSWACLQWVRLEWSKLTSLLEWGVMGSAELIRFCPGCKRLGWAQFSGYFPLGLGRICAGLS